MPVTVLIGAQWGDEGKGRAADWLAREADILARYAGGDNAGHTITIGDDIFKLHLIPAGVLHEGVRSVLGHGMVINPERLLAEMAMLTERGIDISPDRLLVSERAHLITPAHRALDAAREAARGEAAIGTTQRGIGPAYTDKVQRQGLSAYLMRDAEAFGDALQAHIARANEMLTKVYSQPALDADEVAATYTEHARRLAPYVTDITPVIHAALDDGAHIVCEGAQGTLLDIDLGHYPFVTSSSPSVAGALSGLSIGPKEITRVVGATKAFSTRVGAGPMPTEQDNEIGDKLRGTGENPWDEYGTTTGRARRCGWLDGVALRYAARANGFTDIVVTKLDILSGFEELKIAVAYELDGQRIETLPADTQAMQRVQPVYETLSGWQADIMGQTDWQQLPAAARRYVERISEIAGCRVAWASVGPERHQVAVLP